MKERLSPKLISQNLISYPLKNHREKKLQFLEKKIGKLTLFEKWKTFAYL